MFGLGMPELLVILAIAGLVFGGRKLPEIGAGLGKAIASFKGEIKGMQTEGKNLIEGVPGVKEAAAVKEQVDRVRDLGKILK